MIFPKMEKDKEDKLKEKIFTTIFEADTPKGKLFDIALLVTILISVALIMIESVISVEAKFHTILIVLEWIITLLFTIEFALRIYCVKHPFKYIFSFYGIIDLLSILPSYLALFFPIGKFLSSVRILRLFRVIKIFELHQLNRSKNIMVLALRRSKDKIIVFLSFIMLAAVVIGSIMYIVESRHPDTKIDSIPKGIYWTIVTLTTVGFGDITPVTGLGQFIAMIVMVLGYGVIAVPTGIVSVEAYEANKEIAKNTQACQNCGDSNHMDDAIYCKTCGEKLN